MDIEALYIRFISFFRSAFLFENNTLPSVYTIISYGPYQETDFGKYIFAVKYQN